MIFDRRITAEFVAGNLWEYFVYPNPSRGLARELGRVFRESGYEIRVLLHAIFRHPEFYSERAYRSLLKSPVEMICGFMRELELGDHALLPIHSRRMNQFLFEPPDVGGWNGGVSWISTSSLLQRYNFVRDYTAFARQSGYPSLDLPGIIQEYGLRDARDLVDHFVERLVQGDVSSGTKRVLEDYLHRRDDGSPGDFEMPPWTRK